jgi:threonine dehydrogenase-like Zn-dependent dehydrogenase
MFSILKKAGVKDIFMIDKLPYRVKFAKDFGATESFLLADDYAKKNQRINRRYGNYNVY